MLHKQLVESLKLNTIYLDQLQDDIGKWHDTAVAVRLLASGDAGNKAKVGRLQKDQDKAGEAIHAAGNGFGIKLYFLFPDQINNMLPCLFGIRECYCSGMHCRCH